MKRTAERAVRPRTEGLASGILGDLPGNSVHRAEHLAGGKAETVVKGQGGLHLGVTERVGLWEGRYFS